MLDVRSRQRIEGLVLVGRKDWFGGLWILIEGLVVLEQAMVAEVEHLQGREGGKRGQDEWPVSW